MIFKDSYEVIQAIEAKKRNGIKLRNFKAFMASIQNPQYQLKCIHVGGTNGKGSTTNALRSILECAGYTVGTFTSPYLETHHDRIRINDAFIEDAAIVAYANAYYDKWVAYDLSMFEIDMFIAVQYFVDHAVDIAVFEVGLGGEQDATNIIDPMVSLITNIGKDHMEYLGHTYTSIATAKAGIIKANRALITGEERKVCLQVFRHKCQKVNASMFRVKGIKDVYVDDELHFTYRGFLMKQKTLAAYQAKNSALAMEAIFYLREHHMVAVSDEAIRAGIYEATWKGRFEVIHHNPLVIIDGAHNEEGIAALVDSCRNYAKIKILFSALGDKPYDKMLDLLLTLSDDITVCEFAFYRATTAEKIAGDHAVKIAKDYKQVIDAALMGDTPLLVCGSLYFIAEVRNYMLKKGASTLF